MHLGHPVAQRVHDQLQRVRVPDVEGVPGAGVVHVVAQVVLDQPVVRRVVDALHAQRRAEVVALRGVVVDHVEDHLDAGLVHGLHQRLELLHLLAGLALRGLAGTGGVVGVRGEEGEGVVAPVVAQSLVEQGAVLDELVHRHQLDGGDAQPLEVVDDRGVRQPGVRAALLGRDLLVQLGHSLDVCLVDDRLVVGDVEASVALPVEERVDHHGLGHVRAGVVVVARVLVAEGVAVQALVPVDVARGGLGVGVEQQLVRVAAQPLLRVPRPAHPVAVALTGLDPRQVAVPDVGVDLGQLDPGLGAGLVEEAELDLLGDLAEQREVGAAPVERRAQRVGAPRPDLHWIDQSTVGRGHGARDRSGSPGVNAPTGSFTRTPCGPRLRGSADERGGRLLSPDRAEWP